MANSRNPQKNGDALAFSVEEASKKANLGRTKIYEMINSGALPAHKAGRRTLIITSELEAALKALPKVGRKS